MKIGIRGTCSAAMLALALGVPLAHAGVGTISFVGAIVVPTCGISENASAVSATGDNGCGAVPGGQSTPVSLYRQEVVPVATAAIAQDRLLAYLAGYAGTDDARLVTRTYE